MALVLAAVAGLVVARAQALPRDPGWTRVAHDPAVLRDDLERLEKHAAVSSGAEPTSGVTILVWVIFTDKGVSSDADYAAACTAAAARLTAPARARRALLDPGALVDYFDLPVRADYAGQVQATGARLRHLSRWLNAASVEADPAALRRILLLPSVARLLPLGRGHRRPPPDASAPARVRMAGVHALNYGPSEAQLAEIQVTDAHDLGYSGAGIMIAMLDTGYFKDHEAFAAARNEGRIVAERDFINGDLETQNEPGDSPDQHSHGTLTWSALGGATAGELYGPAYGASFALAKTEDVTDEQPIEEDHWLAASEWADSLGANIISSSLGYLDWYTYEDMDGNTAVTSNAADIAASRNILTATAAGNEGASPWFFIIAPADADSVLACGAVDELNQVAEFSSHGPTSDGRTKPEVCARGVDTHCATPKGTDTYGDASGTSLSTPLVGGSAALVLEAHPTWTAMQVRRALMLTADTATNPDNHRGFGRIQVLDAIQFSLVAIEPGAAPAPTSLLRVGPNPFAVPVTLEIETPSAGRVVVDLFGAGGRHIARLDDALRPAGSHRLVWNGRDPAGRRLVAGVYLLRVSGAGWDARSKLVIAR